MLRCNWLPAGPGGALEALEAAREEGLIQNIGVTGHVWPLVAKAVATGRFDTVLCWYNCAMDDAESTVFPEAAKHNTGVVIMNASARGGASAFVKDLSTADGAPVRKPFPPRRLAGSLPRPSVCRCSKCTRSSNRDFLSRETWVAFSDRLRFDVFESRS